MRAHKWMDIAGFDELLAESMTQKTSLTATKRQIDFVSFGKLDVKVLI